MGRALLGVCVAGLLALACGGDPPTQKGFDTGKGVSGSEVPPVTDFEAAPYPEAPYGTQVDSIMANLDFLGWRTPGDVEYDVGAMETIKLSDYYDPDGSKGYTAIMINSSAGWCSVCKAEYKGGAFGRCEGSFKSCETNSDCSGGAACDKRSLQAHYEEMAPKGVVFLGSLFEDASNPPKPATPQNVANWAKGYNVNFPMADDPGFKLGAFFSADATPENLVVDPRTMRLVGKVLGGDEGKMFMYIEQTMEANTQAQ